MAPKTLIKSAVVAMQELGIHEAQVKKVLKNLLPIYDNNWTLIAEDNYRVLADAIFDNQEVQENKGKTKVAEDAEDKDAVVEKGKKKLEEEDEEDMSELERPLKRIRRRGEGGIVLNESTSPGLGSPISKEPKMNDEETAPILLPFHPSPTENDSAAGALIIPNDDSFTDMPSSSINLDRANSPAPMPEMEITNGHVEELDGETISAACVNTIDVPPTAIERFNELKLAATLEESSALELASSASGEVKINLSFAPETGVSNLNLPSMEELRRAMEDKCLRSYKILDPNFSVVGFLNDICSCYLDLATKAKNSANQLPENIPSFTTNVDVLQESAAKMVFTSNGSNDHMRDDENRTVGDSMALVVVPECQISADEYRMISNVYDITLGKETVEIPWVNEVNDKIPPSFRYTAQSIVYLDAAVKFSLANIRDFQCCSSCSGDCLNPTMGCNCATALSGFAYTADGLLQKDFLEECIAEARDAQKQVMQYCNECPVEKAKEEEILEQCNGHLKRNFIKECWSKCGCTKNCGNRVVQLGIQNKLQVFFTSDGRGWGLRTLENLPAGAFVCEFAGEILTIQELYKRNLEKVTSLVILDAHWGSEELSGDNKSLCLDGTQYGNISRFINHRCLDANLIEIPVHVENTDAHYYRPAFFTTREINAMEELTWDYGMEFNDHVFPTTPFHCRCGSEYCRNIKRHKKSKKRT